MLAAACVSALVVNANTSAVSILLPSISADVDAPVATLQWAVTGYSLVGAAVIVTSGALGDVLGRRKVFLAGLVLFVASCVLIALSTAGAGVVAGRMIQGAAGSTILACGMSLLSVASSGKEQMKAITIWGAASAAGAAAGPLVGGVLVDTTGWQGLFWIDAAIAAACIPLTLATVQESSDPHRSRSIDFAGTVLIAAVLVPLVLALSKGNDWGWASSATLGCLVVTVAALVAFVYVEQHVEAPLAARIGAAPTIALGFALAAAGFAVLAFVKGSWTYGAFVLPLIVLSAGMGFSNGPASSASTSAVAPEQVGEASGISNMARYVGGAVAVAAIAMIYNAVTVNRQGAGEPAGEALAAGLSAASLTLAIFCAAGIALALLMLRHRPERPEAVHTAAAAAATSHTIPTQPVAEPVSRRPVAA